ncbi:GIY-YIG nuclease family protein [Trinickia symbiotica]|uniref:GIY-YIG nuclease family protein n=1 Tax=Trinickia symbiotica TaxID=863227 RepID=UPI00037DB2B7|nr:GIY-YIG nuclease family protein [Trinickia symbiotica]
MNKDDVISRIRELASRNGGKVSFNFFIEETGISAQRLRRQPWFGGWNALLQEIGVQTSIFSVPRTSDDVIVGAVAELTRRLGRWPTEDEFVREKQTDPMFPTLQVIRRAKKSGRLWELLNDYRADDDTYAVVRAIAAPRAEDQPQTDGADATARVRGYVYMLRHGRHYKIGCTTTPTRRFREVRIELPEETVQVHAIETDDPRGIEAYWHRRFDAKRIRNSEWFELDAEDIRSFKRRKYQ